MSGRRTPATASTLVAILALQQIGCAEQAEDGETYELRQETLALEDEKLFRELMFPNAKAAKAVPELGRIYDFIGYEQLDEDQRAAMAALQDVIVENIHKLDPEFMRDFAAGVTSGDVQEVDQALSDAHIMLRESLMMLGGIFKLLLQEENIEALREELAASIGEKGADMLTELKALDPAVLEAVIGVVEGTLSNLGLPHSNLQIATSIDSRMNLSTQLQSFLQISAQLQSALNVQLQSSTDLSTQAAANVQTASITQLQLQASTSLQKANALILESTIDKQLSLANQNSTSISVDLSTGQAAAVVVAKAVAVTSVVVLATSVVAVSPRLEGMNFVHGESHDLFREQMLANITKAYAV